LDGAKKGRSLSAFRAIGGISSPSTLLEKGKRISSPLLEKEGTGEIKVSS